MSQSSRPAAEERRRGRPSPSDEADASRVMRLAVGAWLVPGAGHVLQGRVEKGAMFFAAILTMFIVGIASGGRLFPLQPGDLLVFLEAVAEWMVGVPRLVAGLAGFGAGVVTAPAYEYGNTFLIVAGLLNALVVLDAVDIAKGRKPR